MTHAKEATLRRIAIVLASLPQPVAQRLLGSLQSESQQQVRAALGSLADIDPLERRRAMDGFAMSLRGTPPGQGNASSRNSSDAAEIVFSRVAMQNLDEQAKHTAKTQTQPRPIETKPSKFDFLANVADQALASHLAGEMPQTLAIILANMSPQQAARILPRLDVRVRSEAMRRIANLKELPIDLLDEIASQLLSRLGPLNNSSASVGYKVSGEIGPGKLALDAILAQLPAQEVPPSQKPEPSVSAPVQLVAMQARTEPTPPVATPLKIAAGTSVNANRVKSNPSSPLHSTDGIHDFLVSLSTDRLRESLGSVSTRQAILTLCGLPTATAEAVLASLPRKQSKQVREQLGSLGSLELRDIDEAKQAVATVAHNKTLPRPALAA